MWLLGTAAARSVGPSSMALAVLSLCSVLRDSIGAQQRPCTERDEEGPVVQRKYRPCIAPQASPSSPVSTACQPPPDGSAATLAPLSPRAVSVSTFALELINTGVHLAGSRSWRQGPWMENLAGGLGALWSRWHLPAPELGPVPCMPPRSCLPSPCLGSPACSSRMGEHQKQQLVALCLYKKDPPAGLPAPCFSHA